MSIIERAEIELKHAKFGEDDSRVMLDLMRRFFDQWDSGGAVSAAAPVLAKLIAGKPLSPLTGTDEEWFQPMDDMPTFQNRRCSSVFKEKDIHGEWITYDIDRKSSALPTGLLVRHRWVAHEITFPYTPGEMSVRAPVIEIDTEKELR